MALVYFIVAAAFFVTINGSTIVTIHSRIAHGDSRSIESYPYMISIRSGGTHVCGGTIISEDVILTAGHCNPNIGATIYSDTSSRIQVGTKHSVISTVRHENFGRQFIPGVRSTVYNDIALVKVIPAFVFNETFQPISLFNAGEKIEPGSFGTVIGWGDVSADERESLSYKERTNLRGVEVPIVEKDVCARQYLEKKNYTLMPGEMCAGGNGKSSCQYDSGGPLIVNGRQAGVVSWGSVLCGNVDVPPAIFTEIAYFREWIETNIKKLNDDIDYMNSFFINK